MVAYSGGVSEGTRQASSRRGRPRRARVLDRANVSSVVSAQRYDRHRTTLLEAPDAHRAAHTVIAKTSAPRPNGGAGRSLAGVAVGRLQGEMERGTAPRAR